MTRIGERGGDALADADLLVVLAGVDICHGTHGILHSIDGLHKGPARTLVAAVVILRIGHLDVGTVHQHDFQQPGSKAGGPDLPGEAVLNQHGHTAAVVNVGVGNQYIVNGIGRKGQLMIVDFIPPLLQAAVNQNPLPVDLQAVTAAGYTLVRSKKVQFHEKALLIFVYFHCSTPGEK